MARTLSCCMIWQISSMLQVRLFPVEEDCSLSGGNNFFFIVLFIYESLKAANYFAFSGL